GIWADASTIDGCIFSQGGSLLSGSGAQMRTAFNADPARQAFGLVADLVKQGAALRTTKQQYTSDFGNGRIAMFLGSSTAREFVTPAVAGKFPWGVSVIPQKNPAKPTTVQYGANVVIFKTTPEKERAAWSFMRWLAEPEQTMYWATHSSYMPIRQSVAKHQEMQAFWQKDPQAKQCFQVAPFGAAEPNVRGWQDVRKALEEAYDKVAAGTLKPADALREAETKGNKSLQEKH
ncbi:MAG TPA: extracellular solute-binding protein, partial [Armatimonadota bacterium]|nr:extracellular solute-binding protein [Armatimonadota bacterium]